MGSSARVEEDYVEELEQVWILIVRVNQSFDRGDLTVQNSFIRFPFR